MKLEHGDLQKGFSESDVTVEGEIRSGAQEHFYMEPFNVIAYPMENNEMEIVGPSQTHNEVQVGFELHWLKASELLSWGCVYP